MLIAFFGVFGLPTIQTEDLRTDPTDRGIDSDAEPLNVKDSEADSTLPGSALDKPTFLEGIKTPDCRNCKKIPYKGKEISQQWGECYVDPDCYGRNRESK
eukprot:NODE_127_length_17034_cov_0.369590.p19 type:complete len:100 gc:universal NODE_127_length_17034_cov_0.369590:6572-6273(-)